MHVLNLLSYTGSQETRSRSQGTRGRRRGTPGQGAQSHAHSHTTDNLRDDNLQCGRDKETGVPEGNI